MNDIWIWYAGIQFGNLLINGKVYNKGIKTILKTYLLNVDNLQLKIELSNIHCTKIEVSVNDLFSKYDQIHKELWTWSHLLKKSLKVH